MEQRENIIVVSANVGMYGFEYRAKAAREIFSRVDADLIGFQEMTDETLPAFERKGLEFILGKKVNNAYNAIAYNPKRFRPQTSYTCWFSPTGVPGKAWDAIAERSLHAVLFWDNMKQKEVGFLNTHFDNVGAEARLNSMRIVLDQVRQSFLRQPVIFMGDLNISVRQPHPHWPAENKKPYYMALEAGFVDAWVGEKGERARARTFHSFQGEDCRPDPFGTDDPDYIFTMGDLEAVNCNRIMETWGGVYPSDHYWLIAWLKPRKKN